VKLESYFHVVGTQRSPPPFFFFSPVPNRDEFPPEEGRLSFQYCFFFFSSCASPGAVVTVPDKKMIISANYPFFSFYRHKPMDNQSVRMGASGVGVSGSFSPSCPWIDEVSTLREWLGHPFSSLPADGPRSLKVKGHLPPLFPEWIPFSEGYK